MVYSEFEPTWSEAVAAEQERLALGDLSELQLSARLTEHALGDSATTNRTTLDSAYEAEAAERLARFDRLQRILGLLAPAGTAPRTALEQIYLQSETSADVSPIVLDLRAMLATHWGEWTPALREAEGLPPAGDSRD